MEKYRLAIKEDLDIGKWYYFFEDIHLKDGIITIENAIKTYGDDLHPMSVHCIHDKKELDEALELINCGLMIVKNEF